MHSYDALPISYECINGPELVSLGLDLPFPEKLKSALKDRGINVPANYLDEEGMMDWLWTSVLKK